MVSAVRRSVMTRAVLLIYAAAVVVLVVGPWGHALDRLTVRCYVLLRYTWPVAPDRAAPEHYGLVLNVLLFVPLGVGLTLITSWRWWRMVLAAALASTLVEAVQLVLPREADPLDVVANTVGAAVGVLAVRFAVTVCVRRRARPAP